MMLASLTPLMYTIMVYVFGFMILIVYLIRIMRRAGDTEGS